MDNPTQPLPGRLSEEERGIATSMLTLVSLSALPGEQGMDFASKGEWRDHPRQADTPETAGLARTTLSA